MQVAQRIGPQPEHLARLRAAGVEIELLGAPPELVAALRLSGAAGAIAADTVARLICTVRCVPVRATSQEEWRPRWVWTEDGCQLTYLGGSGRLRALSPGRFAASIEVPAGAFQLEGMLTALAVAVVSRRGGLVMHTAAIDLDGRAILFVGPSGTGKTTACNHMKSARGFVRDRAVLIPSEAGWTAWTLPGWEPNDQDHEPSAATHLPVGAILGIERGTGDVHVRRCSPLEALRLLRESAMVGEDSRDAEELLLDRLDALSRQVPCGVVTTVLGRPCDQVLRAWLEGGAR